MDYPRLVYYSPGKNPGNGGTFEFQQILNDEEHDAAIAEGWADGVLEAFAAQKAREAK